MQHDSTKTGKFFGMEDLLNLQDGSVIAVLWASMSKIFAVLYVIDNIIISHLFLEFLWDTNTQFVSPTIQAVDHRVDSKAIQTLKYIFCLGDLLEAVTFWLLSCDSSATTKLCLFLTQNILVCCPRASHMHSTILGKLLIIPKGFLLTFYGLLVLSWQYQLTR